MAAILAGRLMIRARRVAQRAACIPAATAAARAMLNAVVASETEAALAAYRPEGQVGQGPVLELGDDLFDDRVPAVDLVGLDGGQVAAGDERVGAPGREQLALHGAVGGQRLEPADPAHHEAAGHVLVLAAPGERDVSRPRRPARRRPTPRWYSSSA